MATSPFPVDMAMAVHLWRRNFNPKVSKQSQAAKILSVCVVCVCVFLTSFSSLRCTAGNALVQDGTESFWLCALRQFVVLAWNELIRHILETAMF